MAEGGQRKELLMIDINLDTIDCSGEPPVREPERQYYYMAKCREIVRKKTEELGRPLTASIRTFGCPKV